MKPSLTPYRNGISQLCRAHHVRKLDLFGSARGQDLPPASSDVDFLVEFADLPATDYARHYFALREALVTLLGREVDLVVERAIRNRFFRASVNRTREPIFAA